MFDSELLMTCKLTNQKWCYVDRKLCKLFYLSFPPRKADKIPSQAEGSSTNTKIYTLLLEAFIDISVLHFKIGKNATHI